MLNTGGSCCAVEEFLLEFLHLAVYDFGSSCFRQEMYSRVVVYME
jgi:hypothetical protein